MTELLRKLVSGSIPLQLSRHPSLLIFGFDDAQKNAKRWLNGQVELIEAVKDDELRAIGKAKDAFPKAKKEV
jgi:hypothetical protein